ncbi:NusG domain II-containing protein [Roseburia hominis]
MNIFKNAKKNDWILLGIVLGAALVIFAVRYFTGSTDSGYVEVRVDGEVTGTYDLAKDQEIVLGGGKNTMTIRDGKVKMTEANCPDQLCMHQKAISRNQESIICLPNKIVLQIVNQDQAELDAVAK